MPRKLSDLSMMDILALAGGLLGPTILAGSALYESKIITAERLDQHDHQIVQLDKAIRDVEDEIEGDLDDIKIQMGADRAEFLQYLRQNQDGMMEIRRESAEERRLILDEQRTNNVRLNDKLDRLIEREIERNND